MIPYPSARTRLENDVVVAFAGKAAERRAKQRDHAGWLRMRSPDELTALHEAGHAIAARIVGRTVLELSVIPQPAVPVGRTYLAGFCKHGDAPDENPVEEHFCHLETDSKRAAQLCMILSDPMMSWKPALRTARELRERARTLVEMHWRIISILGGALAFHKHLRQDEIGSILDRWMPAVDGSSSVAVANQ